jgi:phosphoribosylamine-glycine ligase
MAREKVAVIDTGGRGSALVDRFLRSEHVGSVIAIPGNDMMKQAGEGRVYTYPGIKTSALLKEF